MCNDNSKCMQDGGLKETGWESNLVRKLKGLGRSGIL